MFKNIKISIIISLFVVLSVSYADWPRYLGKNGDGKSSETGIAHEWEEDGPKVLWEKSLGVGYGGASIQGNEVYLLDRVENKKDVLRCYAFDTGKEMWSKSFVVEGQLSYNGSRSTPTIGEKYVYAFGPFGDIYCVNRKTHESVWTQNLLKLYNFRNIPRWGFSQSPLLYKNKVIVAPCVPNRAGLIAFDADTGEEVWHNKDLKGDTYVSPMVYNIDGVDQIIMIVPRFIIGVNPETGETLWTSTEYSNNIPIPGITPLGNNRFFFTGGYRGGSIIAEIKKHEKTFKVTTIKRIKEGAQIHPGIFMNNHIYVNLNENSNLHIAPNLACVDLNGKIRWNTKSGPSLDRGGIISVDGLLIVLAGQTGMLYLIDPDPSGLKILAKTKIFEEESENYIWSPMAFSEGRLILRDQNTIKCLDLRK